MGDSVRPRRDRIEDRIGELEAELTDARLRLAALAEKLEQGGAVPEVGPAPVEHSVGDAAAHLERLIEARTSELEEKTSALEAANHELRSLTQNLDQIVRQRTRALAESEAQLRRKNAELDRVNRMKAEFISIAAHELRTPMTTIVGYLDLILEKRLEQLPEDLRRPMSSLRRNAHRLKRLVDDMLDVSRLESGRISLARAPCSLAEIALEAIDELSPLSDDKRQTVQTELAEIPPIDADRDRVHQIVANLLA